MSCADSTGAGSPKIDATAADWLARRVRGLTTHEHTEFADWLRADPRHARAIAELEQTWSALDGMKYLEFRLPDGSRFDADLPPVVTRRRRRPALVFTRVLAAAAALAVAWLGWWQPARATAPFAGTAMTEIGGLKKMNLPDGSVVSLNTASAVEVDYTATARSVRLVRGEAHFSVAKDPARPFVVEVRGVDVRAVGTTFNIRLRSQAVEVLVTEGQVRVDDAAKGVSLLASSPSAEAPLLLAGERLVVAVSATAPAPAAAVAVAPEEIERALAWQTRRLRFDAAPLAEVVAEFNRYNHHQLVLADARLEECRFGGTFHAGGSDAFVRLLESRFGVKAERSGNETRLRLAAPEKSP